MEHQREVAGIDGIVTVNSLNLTASVTVATIHSHDDSPVGDLDGTIHTSPVPALNPH